MKISKKCREQILLRGNTLSFIGELKKEDFLGAWRAHEWKWMQQRLQRYVRFLKQARFLAWEIEPDVALLACMQRMCERIRFLRRTRLIFFLLGDCWWREFVRLRNEIAELSERITHYENATRGMIEE